MSYNFKTVKTIATKTKGVLSLILEKVDAFLEAIFMPMLIIVLFIMLFIFYFCMGMAFHVST